ncbi:GNAT family N-acetyltransferase [Rubrimonas cliftonensis]|uniref:L-amino acid N-acyltransferase YncA n=1 Tax=Rubrimonas cliftonensis TaxID=89524 RepID=A0A1H4D5Z5_9RHOB|nr:GNAT family N-acetyltransferase [Rubrimonas cliftonensis]SEA67966.1 L-amino acid N-acyltransferase YncA [Rubrimonas cliftonensis]
MTGDEEQGEGAGRRWRKVGIRAGTPADAAALAAMMLDFEATLNAIATTPDELTDRTAEAAAAMAALALRPEGPARVLIAEAEGACAGYLAFSPVLWMDDAATAFFISDLFVSEAVRGAGAGRALMEAAAAAARAEGAGRLVWCVWRRNAPALAFYDRLGAEELASERLMTLTVG